ncbi:putative phospholipase B-like 2 isoform X3 [Coturnix japonica]|uniref:putative phospholipase B-like 2 isoform X3 n=1 Tax=Coturnix japonica TaxID=93934 RepID=UPI0013A5DB62|nr:putative phospholipase B-like 2 isoform X3 [Coturnix japonica]
MQERVPMGRGAAAARRARLISYPARLLSPHRPRARHRPSRDGGAAGAVGVGRCDGLGTAVGTGGLVRPDPSAPQRLRAPGARLGPAPRAARPPARRRGLGRAHRPHPGRRVGVPRGVRQRVLQRHPAGLRRGTGRGRRHRAAHLHALDEHGRGLLRALPLRDAVLPPAAGIPGGQPGLDGGADGLRPRPRLLAPGAPDAAAAAGAGGQLPRARGPPVGPPLPLTLRLPVRKVSAPRTGAPSPLPRRWERRSVRGAPTQHPPTHSLLQLGGDLEDLEAAFNSSAQQRPLGSGSCSALLKLLPGCQDLLVAHDTWAPYQSMLRLIKKYTLPFRAEPGGTARVPGSVQVFSSYPGTIFSGDDFYILSSGLVSAACTLTPPTSPAQPSHPHRSHWRPPLGTVTSHAGGTCGLKAASWNGCGTLWPIAWPAAVLSGPASSSASTVARRAGTQQGLLTVLEQIPYFEEIFNASGNLELVLKYGDWFTYDKNPRAQIFRRNQSQVHDVDSMVRLMRSNNYLQDPLSQCRGCDPPHNAENAISARSDLNPANGTYPFAALHQRCHGGTDTKVTSFGMARSFGLVAASGPTWDDVPPFRWSTSPCSHLLHMGHPDLWRFPPIKVRWD